MAAILLILKWINRLRQTIQRLAFQLSASPRHPKIYDKVGTELHLSSVTTPSDHRRVSMQLGDNVTDSDASRGTTGSFGVPVEPDPQYPPPDIATLDAYALERWEVCPRRP